MSRPKVHGDRVTTAIRLPVELHGRLLAAADEGDVSANFLIAKAIEDFLPRLVPVSETRLTRSATSPTGYSPDEWGDR